MSNLFDGSIAGFMLDTMVWTGALIALVLLLRRPVARLFGPQIAYALWALPLLRLILPPIELPARFAPASAGDAVVVTSYVEPDQLKPVVAETPTFFDPELLFQGALAIWLLGAVVFLIRRFGSYFSMRRDLLAEAREVGRDGAIRIVETPATNAPLAFGLRHKVVALPTGFMADYDLERRDLALAHELSHHRGHDLLINFLAQPLFAIHWFNPLAYLGWLALRRDQEAACDARVMSQRSGEQRGAYANVIASFAAGPNVALAAPMACPVLGEKSIIHRLRSLNMTDMSTRRRWAGRGMLAAALVALPLTASISYAESTAPLPPAPPAAPPATEVPQAPSAPDAPAAPEAPEAPSHWEVHTDSSAPDADGARKVIVIREEKVDGDGKRKVQVSRYTTSTEGEYPDKEEMAKMMAEVRRELADADKEVAEAMEEHRIALAMVKDGEGHPTVVEVKCDGKDRSSDWTTKDGKWVIKICKTQIMASAVTGLREARAELARDGELPDNVRAEVLRELDAKIKEWEKKK